MINQGGESSLPRLIEVIQKGQSGSIVLAQNPTADAVAAATALYLALNKLGKNVSIACTNKVSYNLTASDKISPQLAMGGDNLVVSFPYVDGTIDKVDYNIQGSNFNLIISPRPGTPKLNPKQVKYSYSGGSVDFIIVLDAPTLNSVGTLYTENQKQFQGKEIINLDRHLTNGFYGTVNFVNKTSSSISELVLKLIQGFEVEIDRDMATNLYAGIASSTNNFTSYSVTAETFENIATLLRMGAIKKTLTKPPGQQRPFQQPSQPINSSFNAGGYNEQPDMVTPIEDVEREPKGMTTTPQDWLKPKIFRRGGGNSSGLV